MTDKLEVILCGDGDRDLWENYVEASPGASLAHSYCWRDIIAETYGHKAFYLAARRGGEVRGALPLIWVKSFLFGNALCSMPYQDYGGICAEDEDSRQALLKRALELAGECRASRLELRHLEAVDAETASLRCDKATLILDISEGAESLWKGLSGKVRNQVRKAQKSGLTVLMGGAELLPEFYPVFAVNMKDLGSPVHHASFFAGIFSRFGEKARLMAVRDNGKTIGGLVCLFHKNTILVPWASSLREYFSKCPNNLLYWEAIQEACNRGCKRFDFGRSSIGSGTYNFKTQWGAKPVQLHWQYFHESSAKTEPSDESLTFQVASACWKRLPVSVATLIGSQIRGYMTQ